VIVHSQSNGCSLQNVSASFHCISHHIVCSIVKISQEHNMNPLEHLIHLQITAIDRT